MLQHASTPVPQVAGLPSLVSREICSLARLLGIQTVPVLAAVNQDTSVDRLSG